MTNEEFKNFQEEVFEGIRSLTPAKLQEYAGKTETFQNLINGAKHRGQHPLDYLQGLKTKAYGSLDSYAKDATEDYMANRVDDDDFYFDEDALPPPEIVWEKIRDSIAYDILYLGLYAQYSGFESVGFAAEVINPMTETDQSFGQSPLSPTSPVDTNPDLNDCVCHPSGDEADIEKALQSFGQSLYDKTSPKEDFKAKFGKIGANSVTSNHIQDAILEEAHPFEARLDDGPSPAKEDFKAKYKRVMRECRELEAEFLEMDRADALEKKWDIEAEEPRQYQTPWSRQK